MKIAMFTDAFWPRVNGVTVSVDSFSRALINEGHDVLVVCSSYPQDIPSSIFFHNDDREKEQLKIVKIPSIPAFISKEDRIAKLDKWHWVFKQVDSFNPDIIHVNTEMIVAEFGFSYARTHNLPVVYTFHTMWEDYAPNYFNFLPVFFINFIIRNILKNIIRRSYRVIVPTKQIEELTHKYNRDVLTFVLPTGIEIKLFEHDEEKITSFRISMEERFPNLKNKKILLFAGRVAKEKNIGFLLNILPQILEKHPDVVLLIVGNGPDLEYYQEEAHKIGIEKNCVFSGYLDRKDLAIVYSISEIFMFPSLTDTQGLVTLEAMLAGTPVVAIGVMGTINVMGGDNGGYMVKNDMAEFTGRVLDLLGDPNLHHKKSLEAKAHAKSWSIEELAKKLISFYQSAITDYTEEYGHRITPVWELLIQEKWWEINRIILKKKTKDNWQKILSKLTKK